MREHHICVSNDEARAAGSTERCIARPGQRIQARSWKCAPSAMVKSAWHVRFHLEGRLARERHVRRRFP
jgi:hypothetical protein